MPLAGMPPSDVDAGTPSCPTAPTATAQLSPQPSPSAPAYPASSSPPQPLQSPLAGRSVATPPAHFLREQDSTAVAALPAAGNAIHHPPTGYPNAPPASGSSPVNMSRLEAISQAPPLGSPCIPAQSQHFVPLVYRQSPLTQLPTARHSPASQPAASAAATTQRDLESQALAALAWMAGGGPEDSTESDSDDDGGEHDGGEDEDNAAEVEIADAGDSRDSSRIGNHGGGGGGGTARASGAAGGPTGREGGRISAEGAVPAGSGGKQRVGELEGMPVPTSERSSLVAPPDKFGGGGPVRGSSGEAISTPTAAISNLELPNVPVAAPPTIVASPAQPMPPASRVRRRLLDPELDTPACDSAGDLPAPRAPSVGPLPAVVLSTGAANDRKSEAPLTVQPALSTVSTPPLRPQQPPTPPLSQFPPPHMPFARWSSTELSSLSLSASPPPPPPPTPPLPHLIRAQSPTASNARTHPLVSSPVPAAVARVTPPPPEWMSQLSQRSPRATQYPLPREMLAKHRGPRAAPKVHSPRHSLAADAERSDGKDDRREDGSTDEGEASDENGDKAFPRRQRRKSVAHSLGSEANHAAAAGPSCVPSIDAARGNGDGDSGEDIEDATSPVSTCDDSEGEPDGGGIAGDEEECIELVLGDDTRGDGSLEGSAGAAGRGDDYVDEEVLTEGDEATSNAAERLARPCLRVMLSQREARELMSDHAVGVYGRVIECGYPKGDAYTGKA